MVEFILVFVVLLAATSGVYALYQKVWTARYNKTKAMSEGVPSSTANLIAKIISKGYVK